MWAITKPTSTTPVTAITTFFPIMVCQKANARYGAATPRLAASATGWTGFRVALFDIPTSFLGRLLSQRGVSRRPLRLQHSLTQFFLTDLRGGAVFLRLDSNRDRDLRRYSPDFRQRRK